ncbi:MAG: LysR family transcriptional regulator [Pseudomonadota bacterium]
MNWAAINFDWNQVRAFLATVEEGSLSAAARRLGATQPTVGRQIAALERDVGVALFERSGRTPQLTPSGAHLVDHARAMAEAAAGLSLAADGQSTAVEGLVRITASDLLAAETVPEAIVRLSEVAPGIEVEVIAANDLSDLMRREADIAIRHVRPAHSDLVAKLMREDAARPYASKAYLEKHGRPTTVAELSKHSFIGVGDNQSLIEGLRPVGLELTASNFRYGSDNGVALWALARRGLGVAVMAESIAARSPEMEPVLPELPPVHFPVWLVAHRELRSSRRIRIVWDILEELLRPAANPR